MWIRTREFQAVTWEHRHDEQNKRVVMVGAGTTHTGQTIVAAGVTELATLRVNDAGSRHGRFPFLSGIEAGSRLQFESRLRTHLLALAALHAHDDARLTSCRFCQATPVVVSYSLRPARIHAGGCRETSTHTCRTLLAPRTLQAELGTVFVF